MRLGVVAGQEAERRHEIHARDRNRNRDMRPPPAPDWRGSAFLYCPLHISHLFSTLTGNPYPFSINSKRIFNRHPTPKPLTIASDAFKSVPYINPCLFLKSVSGSLHAVCDPGFFLARLSFPILPQKIPTKFLALTVHILYNAI